MAEIEWIKLYVNFFDNRKIKQIQSLPEGDSLIVIWIRLLIMAGMINDGGAVYFTEDIPYTDQSLATQLNRPISTVQLALRTFQSYNMIDYTDGHLVIRNWSKYQNVEGMDKIKEQNRKRKQKQRERERLLLLESGGETEECHDMSRDSHVTVTQQTKNKESDIEKEYIDSKESIRQTQSVRHVQEAWNSLGLSQISKITSSSKRGKSLNARINEYGIEKVLEAIERIRRSSFLRGQGNRGWMITFDWFVKPNNFPKVLEGQYDDKNGSQTNSQSQPRRSFREIMGVDNG